MIDLASTNELKTKALNEALSSWILISCLESRSLINHNQTETHFVMTSLRSEMPFSRNRKRMIGIALESQKELIQNRKLGKYLIIVRKVAAKF